MPVEDDHLGRYNYDDDIDAAIVETYFGNDGQQLLDMDVGGIGGDREMNNANEAPRLSDHDLTSRLISGHNVGEHHDPALSTTAVPPDCSRNVELPLFDTHKSYYEDLSESTITTAESVSTAFESNDAQQGLEQDDQRSYASMSQIHQFELLVLSDDDHSIDSVPNSSKSRESTDDDRYGALPNLHDITSLSTVPRFGDSLSPNIPSEYELRSAEAPSAKFPSAGALPVGTILSPRAQVTVTVSSITSLIPEAEISRAEKQNAENPAAGPRNLAPTEHDVISGRGNATNNHGGNKWYLELVEKQKPNYTAANKREKSTVAMGVVQLVRTRDPPGRFLKQDEKTGDWLDIGDKKAVEKVKAAMRQRGVVAVEQPPQSLQDTPVQVRDTPPPDSVSIINSCHFLRYRCVAGPRKYRRSASTRFPQSERRCVKHVTKRVCLLAGIVESSLPLFRCLLCISTCACFSQEFQAPTKATFAFAILQKRKRSSTRPFGLTRKLHSQNQSLMPGVTTQILKGASCEKSVVRGKK
jgi:hypothetical protein